MKTGVTFVSTFLILQCFASYISCARILGIFPHPGKSHFAVFQPLLEKLAERGHNLTVVSYFPHKNPPPGYHDVSLVGLLPVFTNAFPMELFENPPSSWTKAYWEMQLLVQMGMDACNAALPSPQVQRLAAAKGDFDLVIIEEFDTDCFLSIPYKLEVPYIAMSSCAMLPWLGSNFGNPTDSSHVNNILAGLGSRMGLADRIHNTLVNIFSRVIYPIMQSPTQGLVEKYIGPVPPLDVLARNTSLVLVNSYFVLNQPKANQPGVVDVGGLHMKPTQPLPKEIKDFVESAKDGVVVFSMGSILNAATLSEDKKSAFINVFRTIPQKVIWKIDGNIKDLPPNVKLMSWLPQRDILAHPNVIAFIGHGGLLGMTEAVASGTPLVIIPMFGDQPTNAKTGIQLGVAVELPFTQITTESVRTALQAVLSEPYQKRAKQLAAEYNDRPVGAMELAIYWVEYVLRHGGRSLRPSAVDLTPIQYYLIDVAAILAVASIIILYIVVKIFRVLAGLICPGSREKVKKS